MIRLGLRDRQPASAGGSLSCNLVFLSRQLPLGVRCLQVLRQSVRQGALGLLQRCPVVCGASVRRSTDRDRHAR